VYDAAIRPCVTSDVVAVIVRPQRGVRSLPPAGKAIVNASVVPDRVPENVPTFCLWQERQVPSVLLAGWRTAAPETMLPVCVKVHVKVSGPCASEPAPFQVPLRFTARAPLGDGAVGDVTFGAAGDAPQPEVVHRVHRTSHPSAKGIAGFTVKRV
jgi:hypothetical protein